MRRVSGEVGVFSVRWGVVCKERELVCKSYVLLLRDRLAMKEEAE
jgi:hypothetical protein